MKPYTAVCVGGENDGNVITADHYEVIVPIIEPFSVKAMLEHPAPTHSRKTSDLYRLERLHCIDNREPFALLIHQELSVRDAMYLLADAYTGAHIPKNSTRKAEPSEVDVLTGQIRYLQAIVGCQQQIIRSLREETGI
jgi:hypothetical protein